MTHSGKAVVDFMRKGHFYTLPEIINLGIYQVRQIACRNDCTMFERYWELCRYLHEENIAYFDENSPHSKTKAQYAIGRNIFDQHSNNVMHARKNNLHAHPLMRLYLAEYKQYAIGN